MTTNRSHPDIDYPEFLAGTTELKQHLDHRWHELSATDKGNQFAEFVRSLMPRTDVGRDFPALENRGQSHDNGVDLFAETIDIEAADEAPRYLLVQSKYSINEKAEIDSVVSKFQHFFEQQMGAKPQLSLFGGPGLNQCQFAIVTASKVRGVVTAYENSSMASRGFYDELRRKGLLIVLDITDILEILRDVYKKSVIVPAKIRLRFVDGPLVAGDVLVGIVSGQQLVSLYHEHGDSLFYDNIREFLGLYSGRKKQKRPEGPTVNEEIVRTLQESPSLFLQRNNGVVFRAQTVTQDTDGTWVLEEGNIINGCQTTMCLVHYLNGDCLVHAKIVSSSDSWEVAKAANYQTHISIIDLNLARYLRPQVLTKIGSHFDTRMTDRREGTAFGLIDTVNRREIAYEEIKHLFIGLFSRNPNNMFEANYTTLIPTLIDRFFASDQDQNLLFESLFMLHEASIRASNNAAQTFTSPQYATLLQRLYRTTKTDYHAFLTLLAISAALGRSPIVGVEDSPGDTTSQDFEALRRFVADARELIENEEEQFRRYFMHAFKALAHKSISSGATEEEILKRMHSDITGQSFAGLLREVAMYADDDPLVTRKPQASATRTDHVKSKARVRK